MAVVAAAALGLAASQPSLDLSDVGSNCDLACFLASLFAGIGVVSGYYDYRDWRIQRRYEHDRDARNDAWDLYKKSGGYGPPSPPVLPRHYPPKTNVDIMMKWFKLYQWTADHVGGPEKQTSIPAGKA